jgi:hypothetical protein
MFHHATHHKAAHEWNDILAIVLHCYCKFINIFINPIELVEFIFKYYKNNLKDTVN